LVTVFAPLLPSTITNAQTNNLVQSLPINFVAEPGCPIEISQSRCQLDTDPFGAPLAAKTYIDYKNAASQPIVAVKFRLRFVDSEGHDKGTFQGDDMATIAPGGVGSQKWKTEKVYPKVQALFIRVWAVKFADGSNWQSEKFKEAPMPAQEIPQ
jgi:hypothetical protein